MTLILSVVASDWTVLSTRDSVVQPVAQKTAQANPNRVLNRHRSRTRARKFLSTKSLKTIALQWAILLVLTLENRGADFSGF